MLTVSHRFPAMTANVPVHVKQRLGMAVENHKRAKANRPEDSRRDPPRSINRLLGIFERIAEANADGLSLAELSVVLEAPKSSLLIMLRPLVEQDYLVHENGSYHLGPHCFQFATAILANSRYPALIRHHMKMLRDWTGETVIYTTLDLDNEQVVYEDVIESTLSIRYVVGIGAARPIFATASGRVLLAHAPSEWRDAYLSHTNFKKLTSRTVTDAAGILKSLEEYRARGVCFTNGEAMDDASGIAAPVFDSSSEVIGALLTGAPRERGQQHQQFYEEKTMEAARRLSVAIGYPAK